MSSHVAASRTGTLADLTQLRAQPEPFPCMSSRSEQPPGILTQIRPLATYGRRALALVWATSPWLTVALAVLTLAAGLLPAGIAYVGKFLVDSVVAAIEDGSRVEIGRAHV